MQVAPYRFAYKGLLVRVEKRLSHGLRSCSALTRSRATRERTPDPASVSTTGCRTRANAQRCDASGKRGRHMCHCRGGCELGVNFSYCERAAVQRVRRRRRFQRRRRTVGDLLPGTTAECVQSRHGARRSAAPRRRFQRSVRRHDGHAGCVDSHDQPARALLHLATATRRSIFGSVDRSRWGAPGCS